MRCRRVKSEEKHYGQRNPKAFCIEKSQKNIRQKTYQIRNELSRTSKENIEKVKSFLNITIFSSAFTFVGHSQTMKADQKAASIIHEFLKDKYGRLVLYDRMVYFWKLSKLNI